MDGFKIERQVPDLRMPATVEDLFEIFRAKDVWEIPRVHLYCNVCDGAVFCTPDIDRPLSKFWCGCSGDAGLLTLHEVCKLSQAELGRRFHVILKPETREWPSKLAEGSVGKNAFLTLRPATDEEVEVRERCRLQEIRKSVAGYR